MILALGSVSLPASAGALGDTVGGVDGGSGCGSGNRHRLLGLIDARLEVLRPKALLKVCASVGGTGCGGARVGVGGDPGGGNPGAAALVTQSTWT